ncbi:MAG TPA: protein kinase, partial [Phytomonospora sp.]
MTALTTAATDTASGGTPTWRVGDVIDDRYRVVRVHEDGAMGLVFAVRHLLWDIDLAVKSPRPDAFATAAARERFVTEAETWVSLGLHPNICACHYVRVLDGVPRVFAEYVPGGSLRDWIDDGRLYDGGPAEALTRILDIAVQVAWGLDHAHSRPLVHLDVKPGNILIDTDGTAKVTDFGLARAKAAATTLVPDGPSHASVLVSGAGGMTRAYASPEQADGRPVGRRGDVYSFAVSVLEMFTGGVIWRSGAAAGESLDELVRDGDPSAWVVPMPPALSELLALCLATDPARRPAAMAEIAGHLAAVHHAATGNPYPRAKPAAADLRADEYNNRALSLLDLGRPAEAVAAFERALAADPQHLAATYNAGTVRWRRGEISDVELITRQEALPADTWQAWCLLAQTHMERGDLASARELLDGVAPENRGEPEVRAAREALASGRARAVGPESLPATRLGYRARTDASGASVLHEDSHGKLCHRDVASGTRTTLRHPGRVDVLDITPDGRFGVSVDDRLRLWDLGTGRRLRSAGLRGGSYSRRVRMSADARRVVYVDADGAAKVWEPFGRRWKRGHRL